MQMAGLLSIVCLECLVLAVTTSGQQRTSSEAGISDALNRMQSVDLHVRELAFHDLLTGIAQESHNQTSSSDEQLETLDSYFSSHPQDAERVKVGLIQLLNTENDTFQNKNAAPATYTEEDMEHYAEVIEAVSSLNDGRTIPALVGALPTGGIATGGLVKYGDNALKPVLEQLNNNSLDSRMRSTALGAAVTILKRDNNPSATAQLKGLIRSGLIDNASGVRTEAVLLIDCLDGRQDFVSVLDKLAQGDPDRFPDPGGSDYPADGEWYYPVRIQARRVLRDIQINKSCKP